MMSISEIKKDLKNRNITQIANDTGISYQQIWRFYKGVMRRPSHQFVCALSAHLEKLRGYNDK